MGTWKQGQMGGLALRKSIVTQENIEESCALLKLWNANRKLSQTEFGKQFKVGCQSYVAQCLHGKVALTLRVSIAFCQHLNCHLTEFSPRLQEELNKYISFDFDQNALLTTNKLFEQRKANGL